MTSLRDLPSIEHLLQLSTHLIYEYGRPLTLDALRSTLDEVRLRFRTKPEDELPSTDVILAQTESHLAAWTVSTLRPVINATGVILHTNLGRAPLSKAALTAMKEAAENYSTLEYDLAKGQRGSRLVHAESILQRLTGAEAAVVVNNNASAVLLVLSALANRKRVVISRTQLVEIGGGFRLPDVMKQSGAKLVEIGATNKVRLSDYQEALEGPAALVMRAHRSNFKIVGFTEEPALREIVGVAHQMSIPVVDDLGSGTLLDTAKYGLAHEPTVQESLAAGVDVVCFSGDKLLGGPQAGIIVGRKDLIDKIKKHPLARAVRADKICLAALTATLLHYLKEEAEREIPVWRMISLTTEQIRVRADVWRESIGQGEVIASESAVGGGSLPEECLSTFVLALRVKSPETFSKRLRDANLPVIARMENGRVLLDPRTVLDDEALLHTLKQVLHDYC
ncbi:MAG TPA: L-seryl-tRNA(Sec) selenium transferase [Anaerolineales bacterium]|jgi:L-seryl-tRNA(Ser) seleniumtransferase|nr:L-seryl-tRNA(Sec) selenium transferase [Anaerolineales bacterium]